MNRAYIIVGPPGCGKTTLAAGLVRAHLAEHRGIVFAHDPVAQYTRHGCRSIGTTDEWRKLARDAHRTKARLSPGYSFARASAEDVTALALEVGERNNRADSVRLPIMVVYDEASLLGASGSTYMGKLDNELLSTRRHRGVAPVFNIQQPSQLTSRFFEFSTDVALFRQTEDRARTLEGLLLLERGSLARANVHRLPQYRYVHVRISEGIVSEPLT